MIPTLRIYLGSAKDRPSILLPALEAAARYLQIQPGNVLCFFLLPLRTSAFDLVITNYQSARLHIIYKGTFLYYLLRSLSLILRYTSIVQSSLTLNFYDSELSIKEPAISQRLSTAINRKKLDLPNYITLNYRHPDPSINQLSTINYQRSSQYDYRNVNPSDYSHIFTQLSTLYPVVNCGPNLPDSHSSRLVLNRYDYSTDLLTDISIYQNASFAIVGSCGAWAFSATANIPILWTHWYAPLCPYGSSSDIFVPLLFKYKDTDAIVTIHDHFKIFNLYGLDLTDNILTKLGLIPVRTSPQVLLDSSLELHKSLNSSTHIQDSLRLKYPNIYSLYNELHSTIPALVLAQLGYRRNFILPSESFINAFPHYFQCS